MMDCGDFLDGYSDFRDDRLARSARAAFDAHLEACASCARYDRVVSGGVGVLHEASALEVSDDFMDRLQHRLYHVDMERAPARRAPTLRTAGILAAAASLAAVAVVPALRPEREPALPAVAAHAPRVPEAIAAPEPRPGMAAQLEQVGVQVYSTRYRDVLYRTASLAADGAGHAHGE